MDLVLLYVFEEGWAEVRSAFALTVEARRLGDKASEVADRWFFETVVRVHRAGESAPYLGLKPAGLDTGPVIPVAERAIEQESPEALVSLLTGRLGHEIRGRFAHMLHLKAEAVKGLHEARRYVEAMLGLQVWAHSVHGAIEALAHAGQHQHD